MFLTYGITFICTKQIFLIMTIPTEFLLCDHMQNEESFLVQRSQEDSFHLKGNELVLSYLVLQSYVILVANFFLL